MFVSGPIGISVCGRSRSLPRHQLDGVHAAPARVRAAAGRARRARSRRAPRRPTRAGWISARSAPAATGIVVRARPRRARGSRWPSPSPASGCRPPWSRRRARARGSPAASRRAMASSWPGSQSMITGVGMAHHLGGRACSNAAMHIAALLLSAVFAPGRAPTATTGAADSMTTGSAAVTGTVNPGGEATTYHFEYGTSDGLRAHDAASRTPARAPTRWPCGRRSRASPTNTTYHYRRRRDERGGRRARAPTGRCGPRRPPRRRRSRAARRPA